MPVMIQVRNVPDTLHRELVRRADARGMSLTAYIQSVLEKEVGRPPLEEVLWQLHQLEPIETEVSAAELIREDRGPLPGAE